MISKKGNKTDGSSSISNRDSGIVEIVSSAGICDKSSSRII